MSSLLEVIVTSVHDAIEGELGGADRLELVRSLEVGGLTPPDALVQQVVAAVSIPVRVMLRESTSMSVSGADEMQILQSRARSLAQLPIDGLVLGFIRDGALDFEITDKILEAAPNCRATFHRAFDHVKDRLATIQDLKGFSQIDRILTSGGEGSWRERKTRLLEWQRAAAPHVKILTGVGLRTSVLAELKQETSLSEFHIGRAARVPRSAFGVVDRTKVASLKNALR